MKNAGAVLIGKQNLQEFAWGGVSVVSLRPGPQSMERRANHRRFFRRFRGGSRNWHVLRRDRNGHWRLGP